VCFEVIFTESVATIGHDVTRFDIIHQNCNTTTIAIIDEIASIVLLAVTG